MIALRLGEFEVFVLPFEYLDLILVKFCHNFVLSLARIRRLAIVLLVANRKDRILNDQSNEEGYFL